MVDFISILIVLVIIAIIYFMFLKPSSDTVFTNVTDITTVVIPKLQKSIEDSISEVKSSLTSQNVSMKDIKDTLIPSLETKIKKSISDLDSSVSDKNKEFTKSLDNLKKALDKLTETSGESISGIQLKLSNLEGAFTKFVEVTVADIKRIDDKATKDYSILDGKITLLSDREVRESKRIDLAIAELGKREVDESSRIDRSIKALSDRELGESKKLNELIDRIDKREAEDSRLIRELIAQEQADLDKLKRKFPELTTSIDEMKTDNMRNLDKLRLRLEVNQTNDRVYNSYVDTINRYINNAMTNPEISEKIKARIFNTQDYFLEYIKFNTFEERDNYYQEVFAKVANCAVNRTLTIKNPFSIINDTITYLLTKKENLDDVLELFWVSEAGRHYEAGLIESSTNQNSSLPGLMPIRYDVSTKEFYAKAGENISSLSNDISKVLNVLGLPPIVNVRYSYGNTKKAAIQALKNMVLDCDNWVSTLSDGQAPVNMCSQIFAHWGRNGKCGLPKPQSIEESITSTFPAQMEFTETDNRRVINFDKSLQPGDYSKFKISLQILDMVQLPPSSPSLDQAIIISIFSKSTNNYPISITKIFLVGRQPITFIDEVFENTNYPYPIKGDEQIVIEFPNDNKIPGKRFNIVNGSVTFSGKIN